MDVLWQLDSFPVATQGTAAKLSSGPKSIFLMDGNTEINSNKMIDRLQPEM